MIRVIKTRDTRVCQGDVFKDIDQIEYAREQGGYIEVASIVFPLVVVMTQDCDLEQDHRDRWSRPAANKQDKRLVSVLVAPLYNLDHLVMGEHLAELGLQMRNFDRGELNRLRTNQFARYHFLDFPRSVPVVPCVVDFKHYFAVSAESLKLQKSKQFVCKIAPLYRECLSQRFASYLSRIGLPS